MVSVEKAVKYPRLVLRLAFIRFEIEFINEDFFPKGFGEPPDSA